MMGWRTNDKSEATPADLLTWKLNVPPDDEQINGHKSSGLLIMSQVREARDGHKSRRLMTEHGGVRVQHQQAWRRHPEHTAVVGGRRAAKRRSNNTSQTATGEGIGGARERT